MIEDQLAGSRLFSTYEVPTLRHGALVRGFLLGGDSDSEDAATGSDQDDDDLDDTTIPDDDVVTLASVGDSDPDQDTSSFFQPLRDLNGHDLLAKDSALHWGEVPIDFLVQDVFEPPYGALKWPWLNGVCDDPFALQDDGVMLMQRDRSRSRDGEPVPSHDSEEDQKPFVNMMTFMRHQGRLAPLPMPAIWRSFLGRSFFLRCPLIRP